MKKIAVMQPYFLPYMGYWQLISSVDEFVLYDQIEYTKKGWINRNRFLKNGQDELFSLPLKGASDYLTIVEREIADSFDAEKLVRQLREAYRKAPFFAENFPLIEDIVTFGEKNLFRYIENSIQKICACLEIKTPVVRLSQIEIDHDLKGRDKVIEICRTRSADRYLNPIGGISMYDKQDFAKENIRLEFLKSRALDYDQFGAPALPYLSILDVLMFNSRDRAQSFLSSYDIE